MPPGSTIKTATPTRTCGSIAGEKTESFNVKLDGWRSGRRYGVILGVDFLEIYPKKEFAKKVPQSGLKKQGSSSSINAGAFVRCAWRGCFFPAPPRKCVCCGRNYKGTWLTSVTASIDWFYGVHSSGFEADFEDGPVQSSFQECCSQHELSNSTCQEQIMRPLPFPEMPATAPKPCLTQPLHHETPKASILPSRDNLDLHLIPISRLRLTKHAAQFEKISDH